MRTYKVVIIDSKTHQQDIVHIRANNEEDAERQARTAHNVRHVLKVQK